MGAGGMGMGKVVCERAGGGVVEGGGEDCEGKGVPRVYEVHSMVEVVCEIVVVEEEVVGIGRGGWKEVCEEWGVPLVHDAHSRW